MLFNSYIFIFGFAPLVTTIFFLLGKRNPTFAIAWLTLASLFFYAWWEPKSLLIICSSMLVNYLFGYTLMFRQKNLSNEAKTAVLWAGVLVNLLLLGYFKYAHFFANQWHWLINGVQGTQAAKNLPLGISFFTFVQIAFLVDAYRKEKMQYGPLEYSFFVTYYPHLIAGPIIHHSNVIPRLQEKDTFRLRLDNISVGIFLFAVGLFKKTVLADSVAAFVPGVFDAHSAQPLTLFEAWAGAISYTLQIYFDFSGYSDMALGLSKMLNIELPVNFYSPYKAQNIIDFWRRWHISLSRFLRDYLYISLGGNRKGAIRRYINLMITMVLGGLWHGAGWTFIVWGFLHGIYLIINHAWNASRLKLPRIASRVLTLTAVTIAWVFFRANDMKSAFRVLGSMFGAGGISMGSSILKHVPALSALGIKGEGFFPKMAEFQGGGVLWLAALSFIALFAPNSIELLATYKPANGLENLSNSNRFNIMWRPSFGWAVCGALLLLVGIIHISRGSVFLYFQF